MPPVWVSFGRSLTGAAALLAVLALSRVSISGVRRYWREGLVVAVFNAALPYTIFALGETFIPSALAGILNGTLPLWTALMAPFWVEAERLSPRQVAGLLVGFGGVVVLARPSGNVLNGNFVGVLLIAGATLSYAFAAHYSRRALEHVPPQLSAFMQCVGASLLLLPLAAAFHPTHLPSANALLSVTALGVGGTGIAMTLAYWLIKRIGASRVTVVTYMIPPFAVFWGFVALHERPDLTIGVALVLILSGVFFITRPAPRMVEVPAQEVMQQA
jgi:drug/metabolite transporter (DMT)-like permease